MRSGTPHGDAVRHHRLLEDAVSAARLLAPGAPEAGQEEAARRLRRGAPGWLSALRAAAAADAHRTVAEAAEALHRACDWWPDAGPWDEVFTLGRGAARALGDHRAQAALLNHSARHHLAGGDDERARVRAEEAVLCAVRAGDAEEAAWGRLHSAMARSRTDGDRAVAQASGAAAEFLRLRRPEGALRALATAARTLSGAGRHEEARPYLRRLRELCADRADDRLRPLAGPTLAWACLLDGEALASSGRWEEAEQVYRQGLADLAPAAPAKAEVLLCLGLAGVLRRRPEGTSQGAAVLRRALDAARAADDVQSMTRVLHALDDWAVIAR